MVVFEDLTDVIDWLDPMDYLTFWEAIAPYGVFSIAERDHCDGLIMSGKVKQDTILTGLKYIARDGLRDRFGLSHRRHVTHISQGVASLH